VRSFRRRTTGLVDTQVMFSRGIPDPVHDEWDPTPGSGDLVRYYGG
jgi:hypothetical protein